MVFWVDWVKTEKVSERFGEKYSLLELQGKGKLARFSTWLKNSDWFTTLLEGKSWRGSTENIINWWQQERMTSYAELKHLTMEGKYGRATHQPAGRR